jgi:hypothetical protein
LREASYQSHCENGAVIGRLSEQTGVALEVSGVAEPEIVLIDDDACLVEGEDRSS